MLPLKMEVLFFLQIKFLMQDIDRKLKIGFIDQAGNFYFRGADHDEIDACLVQGIESTAGGSAVIAHANADNGNFGDVGRMFDAAAAWGRFFQDFQSALQILA